MAAERLRPRLLLASVFLLFGLTACQRQAPHYSEALMVYPGANQVRWTKLHGTDQLVYQVKVDYPADSVISWISDQLKAKGWQARDGDYWNPGLPTSQVRGWTHFDDATVQPFATVDGWLGQWENGSGDIAEYVLRYQYPPGDRYTLNVYAIFTPASMAKKIPKIPQPQAQKQTETSVASLAGCYELKLGRWWPWSFSVDTELVTPPSRIQLLLERGAEGFERDGFLIRAIKGAAPGRGGPSYWQPRSRDQVDLIWNDGFTGVTLELKRDGDQWRGWAHPHFDYPTIPHIAQVTARRIACEGSQ